MPGKPREVTAEYKRNTSGIQATSRRAVPGLDGAEGFAHWGRGTSGRRERTQDDDHWRVAAAAVWGEHAAHSPQEPHGIIAQPISFLEHFRPVPMTGLIPLAFGVRRSSPLSWSRGVRIAQARSRAATHARRSRGSSPRPKSRRGPAGKACRMSWGAMRALGLPRYKSSGLKTVIPGTVSNCGSAVARWLTPARSPAAR